MPALPAEVDANVYPNLFSPSIEGVQKPARACLQLNLLQQIDVCSLCSKLANSFLTLFYHFYILLHRSNSAVHLCTLLWLQDTSDRHFFDVTIEASYLLYQ